MRKLEKEKLTLNFLNKIRNIKIYMITLDKPSSSFPEEMVNDAIKLSGSELENSEIQILKEAPEMMESKPEILSEWLNKITKDVLCSKKYQNIGVNQNKIEPESDLLSSRTDYSEFLSKFCMNLHSGMTISEASEGLENDVENLQKQLFKDPELRMRFKEAKSRLTPKELEQNLTLRKEFFMDRVYLAIQEFIDHYKGYFYFLISCYLFLRMQKD